MRTHQVTIARITSKCLNKSKYSNFTNAKDMEGGVFLTDWTEIRAFKCIGKECICLSNRYCALEYTNRSVDQSFRLIIARPKGLPERQQVLCRENVKPGLKGLTVTITSWADCRVDRSALCRRERVLRISMELIPTGVHMLLKDGFQCHDVFQER